MFSLQRTLLFVAPLGLAAGTAAQPQGHEGDLHEAVRGTFASAGDHDHGGLVKDPGGPAFVHEVPERPGYPIPGQNMPRPGQLPQRTGFAATPFGGSTTSAAAGGPPNDACQNATIIPGNVVDYAPPLLNTSGATVDSCEAREDCTTGSSHSVWYEYTPDQDGRIFLTTSGSNYDTTLSVFLGCAFTVGQFCVQPVELACANDQIFGATHSSLFLNVDGGETYLIKAGADFGDNGSLLDFRLLYYPPNDLCSNATPIPGTAFDPPLLSTHNAGIDTCEAQESCEFNGVGTSNTVWYSFLPPCDGLVSVNTNGSSYDTVLSIFDGCSMFDGVDNPCIEPSEIACDDDGGIGLDSQLLDVPVQAGIEYRIKVADYNTSQGGGFLDFNFMFQGANPPVAMIDSPGDSSCICDSVTITGTAASGSDSFADWVLDYRALGSNSWNFIASSSVAVQGGVLASWNTAGLPEGHHLLRLTVSNACGLTSSNVRLVYVEQGFSNLDLRAPAQGSIVGGLVCLDGSAWDQCFDSYRLEYSNGGGFTPIGPSSYGTAILNDPLGQGTWNTAALPDGDYTVRLTGTNQCGDQASESVGIVLDNTAPLATLSSPQNCDSIGGTITVRGTARDTNLDRWVLQYTGGNTNGWVTIAQGTGQVSNGVFANWNTAGLPQNCSYTLRLLVSDRAVVNCDDRRQSEFLVSVGSCSTPPQQFP